MPKTGRNKGYEEEIAKAIGSKEFSKLSRGYDLLGNIAIIEFKGSAANGKKIAKILMKHNSNIKTVLSKAGAVSGKYRTRKVKHVSGAKNFIATYKENGCVFRFDVRKVYFSNRLSFERSRLLELVKKKENVMVMFAGVGPFAIEIAKRVPSAHIVAIELNKNGYDYMLENIKLNKVANVKAIHGDVKKKAGEYANFADRIIMPLPMSSMEFLDEAAAMAKRRATVHIYAFSDPKSAFEDVCSGLKAHSKRRGYRIKIRNARTVRPYSASRVEAAIDYTVAK